MALGPIGLVLEARATKKAVYKEKPCYYIVVTLAASECCDASPCIKLEEGGGFWKKVRNAHNTEMFKNSHPRVPSRTTNTFASFDSFYKYIPKT